MPDKRKRGAVLMKWRFKPSGDNSSGEAKYWWSDGTKTEETLPSYIKAVDRLRSIQDLGGTKEGWTATEGESGQPAP